MKNKAGFPMNIVEERFQTRQGTVAVVGLGYVGLPVALAFAEVGFTVLGIDFNEAKIAQLKSNSSYLSDVPSDRIEAAATSGKLSFNISYEALNTADAVLLCVPTPIKDGAPDLSLVVGAGEALAKVLTKNTLVILESTTYPGCTEDLLKPLLESSGLKAGSDFWLAFSPERIDPGNPVYNFEDIPKIVGGIDDESGRAAAVLYEQVVPKVLKVSGTKEAELAKLIENTYRHVNIALVNELAVYAHELGIDIWEAIEAAATKPFGYQAFWPSAGWGGHCIPLDPAYLSWRVRKSRSHEVRFVEVAQAVNSEMPRYVVERVSMMLNTKHQSINGSKILGIGVAYKGGTEDTRESSALKILSTFAERGAEIAFHDPLVEMVTLGQETLSVTELTEELLLEQDVVVIFVRQRGVDWELVVQHAPLVLDCCNALGKSDERITRL